MSFGGGLKTYINILNILKNVHQQIEKKLNEPVCALLLLFIFV